MDASASIPQEDVEGPYYAIGAPYRQNNVLASQKEMLKGLGQPAEEFIPFHS